MQTYANLINMGYDDAIALKAAIKYKKNINKCINYIESANVCYANSVYIYVYVVFILYINDISLHIKK